ncbi:proteasome component [Niveomyces insectorum RCEF 264]|uniref:Proteasome component n=1 Tax=Niveomyces insectorum RCEF 264 TaxID=1081102 RepID=A0A162I944_9HYPO|nr:proteasome component [Niveomyces insectorum RCEF 264]
MATPSTEQRELDLVDKVDFRILNVANNEQKLQDLLGKFLVPLLLKGSSEHAAVRAKVAAVAQRLKLFIQPPGVVLPVAALVQQFKTTDSPVVRHLDIVFIQHSVGRLPVPERRALLPALLRGIADVNASTPALVDIVLQTLPVLKLPSRGSKEDESFAADIGLADPADAAYVADRLGKLFLLSRSGPLAGGDDDAFFSFDQPDSWLRTGANLAETRVRAANFLASGAFSDDDRFMPALYAAAHTDSRVSSIGEDILKRSKVSLEKKSIVEQLFRAHAALPVTYRIRILQLLSRSAISTSYTDDILNVVQRNMEMNAVDAAAEADAAATNAATLSSRSRGLERAKLYKALFEYINWIARIGPNKADFAIGRDLIDYLQLYINDLGWPVPTYTGVDYEPLRAKAYETIGMLAKGAKMSVSERLALANWFFRSLTEDPTAEVVVNVDGALSIMTSSFSLGVTDEDRAEAEPQLRSMLLKYINLSEDDEPRVRRSARHAAAKWANNCLPLSDSIARWIDILAAAGRRGERNDVVEEGRKGLDPWTYYSNNAQSTALPDWDQMTRIFFKTPITGLTSGQAEEVLLEDMNVDGVSPFVNFSGEKIDAFPLAVNYCKQILFLSILSDTKLQPGWEQRMEIAVRTSEIDRQRIRKHLLELKQSRLPDLLAASFEGMLNEKPAIAEPCGRCFVDLASLSPRGDLAALASRAYELLPMITSNKTEIRKLGSIAMGILGAHPANEDEVVRKLKAALLATSGSWKTAVGSELNAAEGSFLALAHLLSRRVYYDFSGAQALTSDVAEIFPTAKELAEASASLQGSVFDALAELWTAGVQCLPGTSAQTTDEDRRSIISAFVGTLSTLSKKGNEKAIAALGRLAVAIGSDSSSADGNDADGKGKGTRDFIELILTTLYDLYEMKQVEIHFTIGGAITAAVACWDADVVKLSLDVHAGPNHGYDVHKRPARLTAALDKILTDCKTTKPSLLKASGIWLFSIIHNCAQLSEVQGRLRKCQGAFMRLLGARDELVQETASRGLSLVYEKGDEVLKRELVRDLVASFTSTSTRLEVDEDTELFDAGALPTGEGKSVTSYKDIVNLANEVGDQTLIYKFMSLAANAATWSTRSAFGRFGLSNILSESAVDPKLYPKLYRYRFDPNTNVQRSMNDIWKALVKDSHAVLEEHFDAIMEDLLKSILTKEWRVREASCAAIAELLQGRVFSRYEKYYKDIWSRALKVLDDVKGSVREAALRLCISLSNTLVRQLEEGGDGGGTSASVAMMNEALPFLMSDKGIESGVEDVKIFATMTVLKIAKHGGKALRPYIAAMVPHLLGLLSTIEPQAFNYYYMRSGEEDKEKLDKMRSAMVSQSPISEAIENSLRNVDGSVMADLAPGLEAAIKSAVGMPTKIGCGRVVSTLATRHMADFAPYAGRFLQLLEKEALDRNDEVSQSYAKAAAYVLRVAPDMAGERFATRFVNLYFAAEDEHRRQKVADAVLALAQISPDHFTALEGQLLPFAYLARHDTDDYVRKACDEVWRKHAGSGLSVARYVPEIAVLVRRALDTAQWALKHGGALTVADAVKAVLGASDLSGQVNVAHLRTLWPLYEKALALKTFTGKEKLLDVFPDFVSKSQALWANADDKPKRAATLRKIATVEAKRNNDAYRVHAFRCLWRVAVAARDDFDMWSDVVAIVTPHLTALQEWDDKDNGNAGGGGSKDRMDIDNRKKDAVAASREKLVRETAANALEAVGRSYYGPALRADPVAVLAAIWQALAPFLTSSAFGIVRRTTWYKTAADLFDAAVVAAAAEHTADRTIPSGDVAADGNLVLPYLRSLDSGNPEAGTEEQRSSRAKAIKALAAATQKVVFGSQTDVADAQAKIKVALEGALSTERSLDVQKLLKDALTAVQ